VEQKVENVLWKNFAKQHSLSLSQLEQFIYVYNELVQKNADFNLTTILDIESVLAYHFADSLALGNCADMAKITGLVDVGSGAGFPSLPLKIAYPHLHITAIEVNNKKADFLEAIARELSFENFTVSRLDYRTFLRKSGKSLDADYSAYYVCARASLEVDELLRMFKGASPYKKAKLVYWAAIGWGASHLQQKYIIDKCCYTVGNRKRKLVFFGMPTATVCEEK